MEKMSVINPNETAGTWRAHKRESALELFLSGASGDAADLMGARVAGFPVSLNIAAIEDAIDPEMLATASAAVVEVDPSRPGSLKRFEKLAASTRTPLVAAAYDPPLALVRALVRAGAHDVVPLPLDIADLETSLLPIRDEIMRRNSAAHSANGKLICAIKSVGGIGATALLTQLAIRAAENEARAGREVCLFDLDLQFGNAAFQLGLSPNLTIFDLVEAGERLDGDLLRSTMTEHPSRLKVVAAPNSMMPLDAISSEQAIEIIELAKNEFGTVFLDLPSNWTNWSLSLLAQADLVLLLTELSVGGLHRARRQLDLLREQELSSVDLRVVVNRFEKGLMKTVKAGDVQRALGREVSYTIANEPQVMHPATERGVPLAEIKRKSAIGKDIDMLESGIAAALGRER
ncbi:AAA family ATPase [Sphingomonas sp. SM33]|uniref:AAA family ATPase n=1 Tax=Sphingomonas telluris TaxID=2907998 RepID=A0ABS9VJQ5_9SPHN|nr:AAA family ATPase [Sphingomonas telluris]MCH8614769.1 AAA family ATPase [Sphingomonas telluris]